MTTPSEHSPFLPAQRSSFQFSLASLLVAMAIFSIMSACLLWASRLPLVTDELHAWMGTVPSTNRDGTDRGMQLMFLLFCYSSPLLLTGTLFLILKAVRAIERASLRRNAANDNPFEMEP